MECRQSHTTYNFVSETSIWKLSPSDCNGYECVYIYIYMCVCVCVCVFVLIFVEALGGKIYLWYFTLQRLSRGIWNLLHHTAEVRKVRLSHAALLSSYCLGNFNKYEGCPKHFVSLSILRAELQEMNLLFDQEFKWFYALCFRWWARPQGKVIQRSITINKQRDSFRVQYVFPGLPFLPCMALWCLLSAVNGAMVSFVYPSHIRESQLIASTFCSKNWQ